MERGRVETRILQQLKNFAPIGLQDMDGVKLMDRTDVKFVIPSNRLPSLLTLAGSQYRILQIADKHLMTYRTLYYDTPDLRLYHKHQAGHLNRHKIRFRHYVDSDVAYFEVKFKNNRGRTIKTRIAGSPDNSGQLDARSREFFRKHTSVNPAELQPVLWVDYSRLTLVDLASGERITIDLNLSFVNGERCISHPHLAVVEIKQQKESDTSPFASIIRQEKQKTSGLSKYCFGVASMHRHVKSNRFKQRMRLFKKLAPSPIITH